MNQARQILPPSVYVTQETRNDFSPAEQFGEVKFITHKDLHNIRQSRHNEALVAEVKEALKHYDPERDWLVISGSPYVAALVFMLIGHKKPKHVQILRWDNRDFKYVPLHIELRREILFDELNPADRFNCDEA